MSDLTADELLDALGVEVTPVKTSALTPFEERVIAGFEDIQLFFEEHKRLPLNSEGLDIFERIYAVRLEQLRKLPQALAVLAPHDTHGLLKAGPATANIDSMNEDALLAELGVSVEAQPTDDITVLRHVRSDAERRDAEEIAKRTPCKNFKEFKPLFEQAERELKSGDRLTLRFGRDASIQLHDFFILDGQFVYVAEVGEAIKMETGHDDARLRVVFGNGTESNLLLRSLQKALWKDETGRRLTATDMGPLFSDTQEQNDITTGTIYVLRSKSSHPYVSEYRELIHKIGVTGGKIETRISGAEKEATYLLADVEVVATYKLHNINRVRMENLFHRIFSSAQIDITINDRFGNPVRPREWFLVPLHIINEAVERIRNGSITNYYYDIQTAQLVLIASVNEV
jgi:hypothetical protein